MQITLTLPLPAKGLRPNDRCHFMKKSRLAKVAREQARRAMFLAISQVESPAWIITSYHLFPFYATKRHWDDDNLSASCKNVRDGISDACGQDDKTFKSTGVTSATDTRNPRLEILIQIELLV